MGFNLGAFAGGMAKTGIETYQTMQAIESQKKRDELIDLQTQQAKQELDQQRRLDEAYANTQGRVGQSDYAPAIQSAGLVGSEQATRLANQTAGMGEDAQQADAQSVVGTMRQNAGLAQTALPDAKAYTQEQANRDYMQAASRISRKGALEALQLKSATRAGQREDDEDAFMKKLTDGQQEIHNMTLTGDTEGLLKKAKSFGVDVRVEKGAKGAQTFVVPGVSGQPDQRFTSLAEAGHAAGAAFTKHLMATDGMKLFGSYDKLAAYLQGEDKNRIASREVDIKEPLYRAQANQANAHAGVFNNMLQTARDNKEAGKAMQPYIDQFAGLSAEDQAGPKGQAILMQGAVAGAQKSKDMGTLVAALRKPDRSAVSAEREKSAYAEWQGATTDDQKKAVQAKYPDVQLLPQTRTDQAIDAKTKGNAKTEQAATVTVPDRPLYNMSNSDLQRLVRKPRGVSTAEANAARDELEARKGESRMSALPR